MPQLCPHCGRENRDSGKFCAYCQAQLRGLLGAHTLLQGRYQIAGVLGCGGMGAVYLAYDHRLGAKKVAIKENFDTSQQAQQQFRFEAHVLANLDHANLPKVTDHFIEPTGRQYLVMEYVEGEDLEAMRQRYPQGQLPESFVLTVADALLDALAYLHGQPQPVIHRDIKPANVKITQSGLGVTPQSKVKLVDFGLAKIYRPGQATQTAARAMGTPGYAPVEQYSGGTDARSDIYALGATLYTLLTGQVPPDSASLAAGQPLPPPRRLRPDLSDRTQQVIFRAMAVNAGQRFQSATEMRRALQGAPPAVAPSPPVPAPPPPTRAAPPPRPTAPPRRKSSWGWGLLGCAALVIALVLCAAAGGLALYVLRPTPAPATGVAGITATPPTPPRPTATLAPGAPTRVPPTVTPTPPPGAPTVVPAPTHTPAAATATPQPTSGTAPRSAYTIETLAGGASASQGRLAIYLRRGDGAAIKGAYVRVYKQKQDLAGRWVTDQEVDGEYTDNAGLAAFDLAPGRYIVRADFRGYNWGQAADVLGAADVPVTAGQTTRLTVSLGRLTVGFQYGDGTPIKDVYTRVYGQKQDLAGRWVTAGEVDGEYTDNSGACVFDLTPGDYIVRADFRGYNWGDAADVMGQANVRVEPGEARTLIVRLGRLTVGLVDAQGQPRRDQYVRIYTQRTDVAGKPTTDEEIAGEYTDNTGAVSFNLTAGTYVVRVGDQYTYNVPVQSGRVTTGNGTQFTVQ